MTPASFTRIQHIHSLTDWMVLSGIAIEVGEKSFYQVQQEKTEALSLDDIPAPASSAPRSKALSPSSVPSLSIPEFNSLEELNTFCKNWKEFGLVKTASKTVIGQGSLAPSLLVIGDMPEDHEDRTGTPFSSPANEQIKKALQFAGIATDSIYFTYLSKWRPPGKRNLTAYEQDQCGTILRQEMRLLHPKAILLLGESTLKAVFSDSDQPPIKSPTIKYNINHILNYELPVMASQKGEFLVKNPLMKKNFWFSLLEVAAIIRTKV
jgi:uracil-DNA glycosylase